MTDQEFREWLGEPPRVIEKPTNERIQGVGILRYPVSAMDSPGALESLRRCAQNIRQGTVILMSNSRDEFGNYRWNFEIKGGDPGQVIVKRTDEP